MSKMVISAFIDARRSGEKGIYRKLTDMAGGFTKIGVETHLICLDSNQLFVDGVRQTVETSRHSGRRSFYNALANQLVEIRPEIWYMRYPFSTPSLVWLMTKIKKNIPGIRIVMEWPTYPYDHEFTGLQKGKLWIDRYFQKQILPHIDIAVVMGNQHTFKGIPTLHLTNGYTCESINVQEKKADSPRIWVAVGHWQYWHGLDRLIEGMFQYFKQPNAENIVLKVVGEGPALHSYIQQVNRSGLQEKIHFLRSAGENQQNQILAESQLGIGVLGSHRKGLRQHAPLKHRMYACHGLPFIYSTSDTDFDRQNFVFPVSDDEQTIDIRRILRWLDSRSFSGQSIVEYAGKQLDWTQKCREILKVLGLLDAG